MKNGGGGESDPNDSDVSSLETCCATVLLTLTTYSLPLRVSATSSPFLQLPASSLRRTAPTVSDRIT